MKLQRYDAYEIHDYGTDYEPAEDGDICKSDDVARLEASHAELLAVAKGLLGIADRHGWLHVAVDAARAAIAKAEHSEDEPITDDEGDE